MACKLALIPAAGPGTRLDLPGTVKPLVEVGGTPLLLRLLEQFHRAGVQEAIVVVGYRAAEIRRALTDHPRISGMAVRFCENPSWELGLVSSLVSARSLVGQREFIIAMADHFFEDHLIEEVVSQPSDLPCVFVESEVGSVPDPEDAVKVVVGDGRADRIGFSLEDYDAIDMGLFRADFRLLDYLSTSDERELAAALDHLARGGKLYCRALSGRWFDVDTPRAVIRAEQHIRRRLRTAHVEAQRPAHSGTEPDACFTFQTGKAVKTKVVLKRGFVRDPAQLPVIPPESASSPLYVITDTTVNSIYGDDFVTGLLASGYDVEKIVMKDGEESKTLSNYTLLVEQILSRGIDERSMLISLGGGAVCNVSGFIASTLYRGIGLIHIPTTLMAQCDAAISHKQGVNGARGKNLVGSYYAPDSIVVDIEVLSTLEDWLIPDGLSEVVKHALGQDRSYLEFLLAYEGELREPDFLETVVRKNIELKCALMAVDPKELREGMVLQYGHEVGHPVEYLSGYSLNHGQCVGIGMMVSAAVSRLMGGTTVEVVDLHRQVIEKYGLPSAIPSKIAVEDILDMMRFNKRFLREGTRMALVESPGRLLQVDGEYAIPVSEPVLREALTMSYAR